MVYNNLYVLEKVACQAANGDKRKPHNSSTPILNHPIINK
jgi:hypothetical protein